MGVAQNKTTIVIYIYIIYICMYTVSIYIYMCVYC